MLRRLILSAATLAACLFLAPDAHAGCTPGAGDCLLEPPQSEEVNPDPEAGWGLVAGEVGQPGGAAPVVLAMPLPRVVPVRAGQGDRPPAPVDRLAVPMRYQNPADGSDVSCGVQALGMALDGLGGSAPTSASMTDLLGRAGMLYEFGTGVEELAFAAQTFGYEGSLPFHDATLGDLRAQLDLGRPVVVALGTNGEDQPGHFVTVTGISADGRWVAYNDPALGPQTLPIDEFLKLWAMQGNSGVIVAEEPPLAPDGTPVNAMPWVALMAGVMALVTTTPWGARRRGVGGRADAGGAGGGTKSVASKAVPKPVAKSAPKPAANPTPKPPAKASPSPAPRARFDEEPPVPPSPPRFDTEPDPPPLVTATPTLTPTPVATGIPVVRGTVTTTPAAIPTPRPTATVTPGPVSTRSVALASGQSAEDATRTSGGAGSPTGAAISPLFWDQDAHLNGALHADLTIRTPKFTLDRGRPGDIELDWAQAPGPAVFVLLLDQLTRILLPYANADAMAAVEPNVHADIYFNAYPDGVRVPGVMVENHSSVPIWVEGVVVESGGAFVRQVPTDSGMGGVLPPVVGPGETGIVHLTPAEVIHILPFLPSAEVKLFLAAEGRSFVVEGAVSSADQLETLMP